MPSLPVYESKWVLCWYGLKWVALFLSCCTLNFRVCVVVHNCAPTFMLHSLLSGYLTVCYLSICSSCYLQLLSSVFEGRALDLIFFYIDLTKNSDVRLAFEALKVCVCLFQADRNSL